LAFGVSGVSRRSAGSGGPGFTASKEGRVAIVQLVLQLAVVSLLFLAPGKTPRRYPFIPAMWLSWFLGAAISLFDPKRSMSRCVNRLLVSALFFGAVFSFPSWQREPRENLGALMNRALSGRLAGDDQLLVLGLRPDLLSAMERKTPF